MKRPIFLTVFIVYHCTVHAQQVKFDDTAFLSSLSGQNEDLSDSSLAFLKFVVKKQFDKAASIYPEIANLDVSDNLIEKNGKTYLNSYGRCLEPYKRSSSKMTLVALFLRERYALENSQFDEALSASLLQNEENAVSLYYLAKVRYEGGFKDDSKYLLSAIQKKDKGNLEVNRLHKSMNVSGANYQGLKQLLNKRVVYGSEK